jgi:chorismate dehydratase
MSKKFWNISPEWKNTSSGYENLISGTTAGVVIGDRALNLLNKFDYEYDLAEQWFKYTELPFVFAVWAANKQLDTEFVKKLDSAFDFGMKNIDACIDYFGDRIREINYDSKHYLTQNIDYMLDNDKLKAIKLFTEYLNDLN